MTIAIALLLAAYHPSPWGTGESQADDLVVKLVTFGPGDDLTEMFGHSALIVEDTRLKDARLYNYGEFAFDAATVPKYLLGHLTFAVGERNVEPQLELYKRHGRSVHVAELALTPEERLAAARILAVNVLPANKHYVYDHFLDNCTTRPRDVIDRAVNGRLRAQVKPGRMTLREHAHRYTASTPVLSVVLDFVMNATVDQQVTTWEEAFLPAELESQVRAAGLMKTDTVWFDPGRAPVPVDPPRWEPWLFLVGVVVGVGVLLAAKRRRVLGIASAFAGALLGVPGLILFVMAVFTEHTVTHWNENLFLGNPLTCVAGVLGLLLARGKAVERLALRAWILLLALALVDVILKLTPWFTQSNGRILAFALPILAGTVLAFARAARGGGAQHAPRDPS